MAFIACYGSHFTYRSGKRLTEFEVYDYYTFTFYDEAKVIDFLQLLEERYDTRGCDVTLNKYNPRSDHSGRLYWMVHITFTNH